MRLLYKSNVRTLKSGSGLEFTHDILSNMWHDKTTRDGAASHQRRLEDFPPQKVYAKLISVCHSVQVGWGKEVVILCFEVMASQLPKDGESYIRPRQGIAKLVKVSPCISREIQLGRPEVPYPHEG